MPTLPEIPLLDFVVAIASAALVMVAAVYVVRSRSNTASPARYGRSPAKGVLSGELFTARSADVTASRLSLVGSLFLHVLLVASLPVLDLLTPPPLKFDVSDYDLVIVQYDLADRELVVPPDLAAFAAPPERETAPTAAPESLYPLGLLDESRDQSQKAQGPGEGPVFQVMLDEPEPENMPLIEVILGEEAPDLAAQAAPAPTVILWNKDQRRDEVLAQSRAERFEMEGLGTGNAPGLPQANLAGLGVTPPPIASETPALPVPWGVLSSSGWAGNGSGLVAGGTGAGGGAGSGDPAGTGLASGEMPGLMLQVGLQQGGLAQLFGPNAGSALGGSGEGTEYRAGAADGPQSGGLGRGKLTPVPRALHGIILVSNSMGTLPEAAGVLTGNPIYTVYVEVPDAPRKWILQFCVPRGQSGTVELSEGIVRVLSRKSLDPPYAVHRVPLGIKLVPTLERISQMPSRVIVYGNVDAEGNLRNVRMIRGADPSTNEMVLANLREWEFLPAFRDGEPVEVEAVFGIPLY